MQNHKAIPIILGILLLILGSAAYAALPPRISWTPAQLTPESIAPGTSTSYTIVLKHTGILPILATNQLRIVAEGDSAPFVTITQPKFPPIFKRGNQVSFPVTVSVPANTPVGVKNGNLMLKRIWNSKEIEVWRADSLPIELTFSTIPLPPDPGEAGKATIEGIDYGGGQNGEPNGVRDDIDRYIGFTFPESEKRRIAMTQYARQNQTFLTDFLANDSNPEEQKKITRANAVERRKAMMCLYYILGDNTEGDLRKASEIRKKLNIEFLNTMDRTETYLKADVLLGGTVGDNLGDPKVLCEELGFDPDTIPN